MHSAVLAVVMRPSLCLSVTLVYRIETAKGLFLVLVVPHYSSILNPSAVTQFPG